MKPNRLLDLVPRRVLNGAVIFGGMIGIVLQAWFAWDIPTTFVVTAAICGGCVGVVWFVYSQWPP
jgi:hypothetical protein